MLCCDRMFHDPAEDSMPANMKTTQDIKNLFTLQGKGGEK